MLRPYPVGRWAAVAAAARAKLGTPAVQLDTQSPVLARLGVSRRKQLHL